MTPARSATSTASAAPRLRQICLAASTLAPGVGQLQQLFGLGAAYDDPHVAKYGLANAVPAVGHQFIEPLVLPGGFIAFEAAAPGKSDGLVEIVLHVVDLSAVLGDAAALGPPVADGCLALAGMRLRLTPDQPR